ncbi:ABC-type transport system [Mycolicibacterium novocastrense]|uniref:ABC-type transport system n=1 Tax=Mycolicibacterium novocastrense TaxID=59813 RepID=A0ABQ0KHQ6_MYCNV|nr:ABC-type transport system [Mycolicibacterium novocastrense]
MGQVVRGAGPPGGAGLMFAPGTCEFCQAAMHSPILPGLHQPPVPETPSEVWDWSQHTPVRWSHTSPAVHCAFAGGAVNSEVDKSTALHTEASKSTGAVFRNFISMRLRR